MEFDEALKLPNNAPILLADRKFGVVIRWRQPDEIGVQVPGEPDIRWLKVSDIFNLGGGALMEHSHPGLVGQKPRGACHAGKSRYHAVQDPS